MDPSVIDIWIPLPVRGKGRPKFRSVSRPGAPYMEREDADGERKVRKYYALRDVMPIAYGESTKEHEAEVRDIVMQAIGQEEAFQTIKGPVTIEWVAYFSPLMSDTKKMKMDKARGLVPHIKKPDYDNILKLLADAMNGLAFLDDCQINFGRGAKVYGPRDGIRAQIRETDLAEVQRWVDETFLWEEDEFQLVG